MTKNAIAIVIMGLVLIVIWEGFLWSFEVHIEQLPPSVSLPIELTESLQRLTTDNAAHLKEITRLDAPAGANGVISLLQSTTEPSLLVLYDGGLFRRWDLNTQEALSEYDFENANRNGGNFSADGALAITPGEILSSGELNGYTIWDTRTGERLDCYWSHCPGVVDDEYYGFSIFMIDPSGLYLIKSWSSLISFDDWDSEHPEKYPPDYVGNNISLTKQPAFFIVSNIDRMAVDPSGVYFAYALEEEEISLMYFDEAAGITRDGITNYKDVGRYREDANIITLDLVFDYTRTWLASLTEDELVVWDLRTFFDRRQLRVAIEDGRVVAFDRKGELIAVGTGKGIQIYSLTDREKVAEYEVGEVTAINISPDNRLLIWGDSFGDVHLWVVPQE